MRKKNFMEAQRLAILAEQDGGQYRRNIHKAEFLINFKVEVHYPLAILKLFDYICM